MTAPRPVREPGAIALRPRAEVGPAVTPRTVREPRLTPVQPPRQTAQAGPTIMPRTTRQPGLTQALPRMTPARPALQPSAPNRAERTAAPQVLQTGCERRTRAHAGRRMLETRSSRDAVVISPDR
jgi:hypothetical protein